MCPLQNITCQCKVSNEEQTLTWISQSQVIAQFGPNGPPIIPVTSAKYIATATVDQSTNELSSNLSFIAHLQFDPLPIQCLDINENTVNISYSFVGEQ